MALNKKMKQAIQILMADPIISRGKLAESLEVDPSTVSRWFRTPEFKEAWDKSVNEQWAAAIKKAKKTAIELMDSPNDPIRLGATKLVLDKVLSDKHEVSSEGGINININYGDKDE